MERQVSKLKDGQGVEITNPTADQVNATTLDYLCATDDHPLPGASTFSWNWMTPDTINDESGVIAINRNTIANFFLAELLPLCEVCCLVTQCSVKAN
jgi:hypothetical protein